MSMRSQRYYMELKVYFFGFVGHGTNVMDVYQNNIMHPLKDEQKN